MFEFERRGRVAILRMAHGKASALDPEFCLALGERLRSLVRDPAAALVLTGTGGIFSGGVDLLRLRDGGAAYATGFVRDLESLFGALLRVPRPVVAAVNGHAVAGGCILALGCDWRILSEGKGSIGVPELRVGVPFPPVVMEILRGAVSPSVLRALVYGGGVVGPPAALAAGLVDELSPPEALLDRAVEAAERLARVPPASFALAKRQVHAAALATLEGFVPVRAEEVAAAWGYPPVQASIDAFVKETLRR